VEVTSANPLRDAEPLLRQFMKQAYRAPVNEAEVRRFLAFFGEKHAGWALLWSTFILSAPIWQFWWD